MDFFLKILLNYLQSHPDVVEKLVEQLVTALIAHFQNANAAAKTA